MGKIWQNHSSPVTLQDVGHSTYGIWELLAVPREIASSAGSKSSTEGIAGPAVVRFPLESPYGDRKLNLEKHYDYISFEQFLFLL